MPWMAAVVAASEGYGVRCTVAGRLDIPLPPFLPPIFFLFFFL